MLSIVNESNTNIHRLFIRHVNGGHLLATPSAEQPLREGNSFPWANLYRLKMFAIRSEGTTPFRAKDSPGHCLPMKVRKFKVNNFIKKKLILID
jgi:hypothetical protein